MSENLSDFLSESLRIEGLPRGPLNSEIEAVVKFVALPVVAASDVSALLSVFQRDAAVRSKRGMAMQDRSRMAPAGGPSVTKKLDAILKAAHRAGPYNTHVDFMTLLPLTGCNGLIGRLLWLWGWHKLHQPTPASFLRTWYRVSLDVGRMQAEEE